MKDNPVLCVVIPAYNEEAVLPVTAPLFLKELNLMVSEGLVSDESRILYVDDGSRDSTWTVINALASQDPHFCGLKQSRNRGHQNAVIAGLMEAREFADIAISSDCDGQDDISAMREMVRCHLEGFDVVYGVRSSRETDSFFKRFTAESYYKVLAKMGAEVVFNHADYRLASKRVLDALSSYEEVNLFLRGLFPLVGFPSTEVTYERHERMAGESHYPLSKMLALAFDGITSLSIKPIRAVTILGLIVSIASFLGVIWALISFATGHAVSGWASTTCIVCFVGGVQMISLGIIGEYVGKTYMESKHRPRFIISERTRR